jgi:hypothetical protein
MTCSLPSPPSALRCAKTSAPRRDLSYWGLCDLLDTRILTRAGLADGQGCMSACITKPEAILLRRRRIVSAQGGRRRRLPSRPHDQWRARSHNSGSLRRRTAEHIIEVGRMPGRAAHTALHLAARGADDEIGDFEARFVRAFGHEATFDRKRSGGVQRGELVETVAGDWIGALRTFNDDPYSLARQGGSGVAPGTDLRICPDSGNSVLSSANPARQQVFNTRYLHHVFRSL